MTLPLDARPVIVALAGPNGAGKTTFFHAHLQPAGLRFVNADDLARELGVGAYEAAGLADELRRALVRQRESFVFETILSDPVGDKVNFLSDAARAGCCGESCASRPSAQGRRSGTRCGARACGRRRRPGNTHARADAGHDHPLPEEPR